MTGQAFVLTQLSFLFSPTMLSVNDFYLDCFCFGDGTSLMAAQIPASYIWVAGMQDQPQCFMRFTLQDQQGYKAEQMRTEALAEISKQTNGKVKNK